MSAVLTSSPPPSRLLAGHPWVAAVRVAALPSHASPAAVRVRIVPTLAGAAALRARGKNALVAHLVDLNRDLPADPRTWRIVADIDAVAADQKPTNEPCVRSILRTAESSLEATVWVPYELRVFDGHFIEAPIVPGVMQIAWVIALAQAHLPAVGRLCGITAAKFRALVRPGMELRLALHWTSTTGELAYDYRHGEQSTSNGRLRMTTQQ